MRTLVIDTATPACSVALLNDGVVLAAFHAVVGRGHAERLVPIIAELPERGRADRILVDCGPGSFTGVRVGLAAARGLAIGWKVPVQGYSSLALVAAGAFRSGEAVGMLAVVLEGGHGEVFMQGFTDSPLAAQGPFASLRPELAVAQLDGRVAIGSGIGRLRPFAPDLPMKEALPDARDAVLLPDALASLAPSPLYGRAPDAKPPSA